jgi:hypothetical protein
VEAGCAAGVIDGFDVDRGGRLPECEGRLGGWYTFNDGQAGTRQMPAPGTPVPLVVPGGDRDGLALRTRGTCQLGEPSPTLWGAGIAFDLDNPIGKSDSKRGYDAAGRGFLGIRFKARVGDDAGASNVLTLRVPDLNTDPSAKRCSTCYDDYQKSLRLSRDWKEYRVLWSELTRGGFGVPSAALATNELVAVQFRFNPGESFDLYLDDVAFITSDSAPSLSAAPAADGR